MVKLELLYFSTFRDYTVRKTILKVISAVLKKDTEQKIAFKCHAIFVTDKWNVETKGCHHQKKIDVNLSKLLISYVYILT